MSKKDKNNNKKEKYQSIELSSPPCLMSEVDPEYMGLANQKEKNIKPKKDKE
ncbi:MAG: hypothetical protein KDF58_07560 [Alphaproteobacteria bacterium]|nr:hypothetical protein [Alphaproteobacteria bacterium]HPF46333.1 hypothetical protein [Emcibacteraceae bacterium]HRW30190.1 hypothetical protein [Emcibacteraceae bacterium]